MAKKDSAEKAVRDIRRRTRRRFSAEEKIRIVVEGLRGEEGIASLCRREGIAANLYYRWSKEFLEAGKKRLLALSLLAAVVTACATPVGVRRVDPQTVHRELTANALSVRSPSAPTVQVLHRLGLFERFRREPDAVLAELHAGLAPTGDADRLFALAELSFLHGELNGERDDLLAAAAYAYAFLFPGEDGTPPEPFDPRLRIAGDLYNRGLTGSFFDPERQRVVLEGGIFEVPFGSVEVEKARPVFDWAGWQLVDFVSAADLQVRGLRNRYRQRGIGAPLAARVSSQSAGDPPPGHERIPESLRVPVTALLRFECPRAGIAEGRLRATLEVYSQDDARRISIDGREVPLEFETTSSLALGLEGSTLWGFERAGFRSGDFRIFGGRRAPDGLIMLGPYRPGHIPVVLVHGTASSPARWAEMVNELENDPRIWKRYHIWLFLYNTGNPVALSGAALRRALIDTLEELDPQRQDPALQRMVVIGHSQGGLVSKLTVIDSGNRFWDGLSEVPIDELELRAETRELLERALFFDPLPFVSRVVFIATPHRGSYLTQWRIAGIRPARWASNLVQLPGDLANAAIDLVAADDDRIMLRSLDELPTSIDNMTPGNPFLEMLVSIPIDPNVTAHSIIAVEGDGPPEQGKDGVVAFESASIEGVASELVVRSGHSAQSYPDTIEEVRRILLEHAGLTGGTGASDVEPEPDSGEGDRPRS